MINLSIDGKEIQVPEGTTVLRAAEQAGINIPTLCYHPELTPYGGCRLCVVEVEGAKALQPSCTLPATENMVVRTDSERIREARKFVLTMIFSERNHFCPYCQVSGGDCDLQNAAYDQGMTHWDLQPNWQQFPVDASHPHFIIDHNRCILCRRCVRACAELVGNFTLGFEERGAKSFLVADLGVPLGESSCVSCGTCFQVCPTGAIIDRESAYIGKETEVEHHKTICVGCSIGCGIDVQTRDNNLVRIEGDWDSEVNSGVICELGRFTPVNDNRERILTPLQKINGSQKATNWDEAFNFIENKINSFKNNSDNDNLAVISTRLPVNDLNIFRELFTKKLAYNQVVSSEFDHYTKQAKLFANKTGQSFECDLTSLSSSDCVIMLDTNLDHDHQVAGFMIKRKLPTGLNLINFNSQSTKFDDLIENSFIVNKNDLIDVFAMVSANFNDTDTTSVSRIASKFGLDTDQLIKAIQTMRSAKNPVILYGGLFEEDENAFESLINFSKLINKTNQNNKNIISLKYGANSIAASQLELDQSINSSTNGIVIIINGDEDPSEKLISLAEKGKCLIVFSSYINKLTAKADIVLPVCTWLEIEGHYINSEGKLQKANASLLKPESTLSVEEILRELATRLGFDINNNDWRSSIFQNKSSVDIIEL